MVPDYGHAQIAKGVGVRRSYYRREREHGVVGIDVDGFSGGLFNGFHFLLASCVVERTDYYWLSDYDVPRGCEVCLGV